jgi:hypothetical protein
MGWKLPPIGGPVAYQFPILGRGSSREVGNPCIDPSHSIRDIRTVNRNFIPDEEVLCDILLYPLTISDFVLNGPSSVSHLPDLGWKFFRGFCERRD